MVDPEEIVKQAVFLVQDRLGWLGRSLLWGGIEGLLSKELVLALYEQPLKSSPLAEEIRLLCKVANGEIDRAKAGELTVGEIAETLQTICELLFHPIGGGSAYDIPQGFWSEPGIGAVCGAARRWLSGGGELISLSDAGRILYADADLLSAKALVARVRRLVEDGALTTYVDPDELNPTHARKVLKADVERLKEKRA